MTKTEGTHLQARAWEALQGAGPASREARLKGPGEACWALPFLNTRRNKQKDKHILFSSLHLSRGLAYFQGAPNNPVWAAGVEGSWRTSMYPDSSPAYPSALSTGHCAIP